jgi:hypothetical protein
MDSETRKKVKRLERHIQDLGDRLILEEDQDIASVIGERAKYREALEEIAGGRGKYAKVAREALE